MLFAPQNVAVATCHASRCVTINGADLFYKEIIENIFNQGMATLGDAVCAAKQTVISEHPGNDNLYGPAVLQTILGDPCLRIKTPVGVQEMVSHYSSPIVISPNPFVEKTSIKIAVENTNICVRIFDLSGRLVQSFPVINQCPLSIGKTLEPGIYFLTIADPTTGSTLSYRTVKLVKLH